MSASGGGPRSLGDIRERLARDEGLSPADVVELVCVDQLRRWRQGEFIPSEAYFGLHPALRADGEEAFELAYAEFALREELGETPTLDEFLWRFPQHSERFRIQIAMDRAIEKSTVLDQEAERLVASVPRDRARPTPVPENVSLWPTVEGFAIDAEIGRGGMGVVYRARQVLLNRTVALKMILGGDCSPLTTARFLAEGEAVARLHHPNIVQIHGLGNQGGLPYFILEYLEGGSLAARLDGRGWPPRDAARLIAVLALGVEEAHRQGVVHRDLKPSNILLAADDTPKLADFGLAKMLNFEPGLTRTEAILGTPSYMSPEQAEGKQAEVGEAADIYALGAIFYELLTGRPPFRAATLLQTLESVRSDEPVSPSRLQRGLPRDAETICLKCLEKSPSRRYLSARALADDLNRFLARETIQARPSRLWERAARWCIRNPPLFALSTAFIAALAIGMSGVIWKWREAEAQRSKVVIAERATAVQLKQAIAAKRDAEAAQQGAIRTRNDSQRLSAHLALNRALELSRGDEIGPALLWMVESLRFAPDDDPTVATLIRRNLTAWSDRLHGLRQVFIHPESVTQVVVSPNGSAMLTGCHDGKARLWDLKTGKLLSTPWECGGSIDCVAFSPDGRSVVTGDTPAARLRDATTGVPFGHPMMHPTRAFRAEFRRDGKQIVTTYRGESYRIWDARTGAPVGPPVTSNNPDWLIFCATFSPDGQTIVTGMLNRNGLVKEAGVQRWEASNGRPIGAPLPTAGAVLAMQFSPDGRRLLTACVDGNCQVRDATTLEPIAPPLHHPKLVEPAIFSPDGTTILTGCSDGLTRWWDVATGCQLGEPLAHEAAVWGLAFVPGGKFAVTGCSDKNAWLWELAPDLHGTRPKPNAPPDPRRVNRVIYSPDRRLVLTIDDNGLAVLTDIAMGQPVGDPMRVSASQRTTATFSPDGKRIAISSQAPESPLALVWDVRGRLLSTLPVGRSGATSLSFSPDGKRLATLGPDHILGLWDAATGRPSTPLAQQGGEFNDVAFTPDGKTLVAAPAWGPTVHRWDVTTGARFPANFPFAPGTTQLAVSPDGKKFLTIATKTVRLWDASTGKPIGIPIKPSNAPADAGFTDDRRTVCTVGTDGGIRLWDPETGIPRGPQMSHPGNVAVVDIGPDGSFLVSVGQDGTVQLWDVATSRPIGPLLTPGSRVLNARIQPDGRSIAITSQDGTTHLIAIPEPTKVNHQTLKLHFEVRTGRHLDGDQILNGLTPDVWHVLNARLLKQERGPVP
ncbi:protein kinase [Singulisphaera sp. Ch08]|uniref:Protein kinase n=1 Tax=Singulisphaera sp. Ch08 TaxID=3120278 RepID=A0AAU7CSJ7_9BACT